MKGQINKQLIAGLDIYNLFVVLYEMLIKPVGVEMNNF